jgi:hypothetical protein
MTLVWLGIFLLTIGWMRALPIFLPFFDQTAWFAAGVGLIVLGLRNNVLWQTPVRWNWSALLLFASVAAIVWLDGTLRTGFWLLAIVALLTLVPLPRPVRQWALPGLWASGAVLTIQAACVPLLYVFSSRYHRTAELPFLHDWLPGYPAVPWLAWLLYVPLKLLDGGTTLDGSTLYLPTTLDTIILTPTWEKLGLIPLTLFASAAAFVLLLRPDWRRRLVGSLVLVTVYAYVRLLVLFLFAKQLGTADVFWRIDYVSYSFLALPILLGLWWRLGAPPAEPAAVDSGETRMQQLKGRAMRWVKGAAGDAPAFARSHRAGRTVVAAFLLAGGLASFWGFHDPGVPKQGRILIDERHSDWEWTTQPFDTIWYGGKSGYNYYCLADYWNHYYQVETRTDSLSPEFLSQWDVLVVKTPTSSFAPAEVDAIDDFVRQGGGLFLIGDHTNVFGTSTYLNPIAERFGMYFRYDATYNLSNLTLSLFRPPARFAHPVVHAMPDYLFATSCTLYSPLLSENVILGYGLRAMYLDYSEVSYFPIKEGKTDYDFGLFVQAGGVKYGKGRVLGYTDSTCFSNFFMFMPGKPELALASIEWLNRTNRWSWINWIFLLASLLGLILLVREAARTSGVAFWTVTIAAGALAVVLLGRISERSMAGAYAMPEPHRPPVHITFDHQHGNYVLPSERLAIPNWQNFQVFYVWSQRLGIVPRDEMSLAEAVRDSRVLFEIHPFREFSIEDIDLIVDFVRRGGTLVVFESPENKVSTANTVLGPFGMSFDDQQADSIAVMDETGDTLSVAKYAYGLDGSIPILMLADGRTAMGYMPLGKGKVIAFGASNLFSAESMGTTATVPNARQRRLYRTEYDLFQKIVGMEVRGRYHIADENRGESTGGK